MHSKNLYTRHLATPYLHVKYSARVKYKSVAHPGLLALQHFWTCTIRNIAIRLGYIAK